MKYTVIKECAVALILTVIVCNGYALPLRLQEMKVTFREGDFTKSSHNLKRTIRSATEADVSSEELEDSSEVIDNLFQNEDDSVLAVKKEDNDGSPKNITIESRQDTGEIESTEDTVKIESREGTSRKPIGFTDGPNFDTDRTGLFLKFFPFLGYGRPYSGRSHWQSTPPHRPPHRPHSTPPHRPPHRPHSTPPHRPPHRPPNRYKPSPYPSTQHLHKPDYKPSYKPDESDFEGHGPHFEPHEPDYEGHKPPYEPDYEAPKPDPLPPFPPDGPTFGDCMAAFPCHRPPHPDHEEEDYKDHESPPYHDTPPFYHEYQEGFDDEKFEFDFDPPDFFEHSGFPQPSEGDQYNEPDHPPQYDEENEPYEPDHHDDDYPMKPYSDDDEVEFYPPDSYEGFEPEIYMGPPKPDKHIPAGPKPGPPNPHKFIYPPDLNMILEDSLYRDDIPKVEIHNENDHISDDLTHGGIKGLDPEVIDFIVTKTKPYVETHNEYDDQWSRKITE